MAVITRSDGVRRLWKAVVRSTTGQNGVGAMRGPTAVEWHAADCRTFAGPDPKCRGCEPER